MKYEIDYKSTFTDQFEALQTTPLFAEMEQTVEDSPWHREANVLVHTRMVVDKYIEIIGNCKWTKDDYLGAIACAFHDVGKPACRIAKHSEARGNYFAYHGHELRSARLFENYAALRYPMFDVVDIYKVCWMIEHHMPWDLKDRAKRNWMLETAEFVSTSTFLNVLQADQLGRITDDQEKAHLRLYEWLDRCNVDQQLIIERFKHFDAPMLYMPIGASGSGKSTTLNNLTEEVQVFSLDLLRHYFYDKTDYAKAYQMSVDDKTFESRANAEFLKMVKREQSIYVDNTNLSVRRRAHYLDLARRNMYNTCAIVMPVALATIIKRQKTRSDKNVPISAVIQQYNSLQLPQFGEFDEIRWSDHNFKPQ